MASESNNETVSHWSIKSKV